MYVFPLLSLFLFGAGGAAAQRTGAAPGGPPPSDPIAVGPGSESFVVEGGGRYDEKRITVFYHRPESFHRGSPVLMVIPGAGRNGDD